MWGRSRSVIDGVWVFFRSSVSFFGVVGWEIIYTHGETILIHKLGLGFRISILFIASSVFWWRR